MEVKKHKAEEKIERQLAFDKDDTATEVTFISVLLLKWLVFDRTCSCALQETVFKEQVEGLVEEDDDAEAAEAANEQDHVAVGAITLSEKKTERQRKKEKAEKLKVNRFVFQCCSNISNNALKCSFTLGFGFFHGTVSFILSLCCPLKRAVAASYCKIKSF